MGVNLSVMHRKLQTDAGEMEITTTQNWIQFPVSCGRDGTELETQTNVSLLCILITSYQLLKGIPVFCML